jgi:ATP-dependent RNA helicase DDX21
MNAKKESKKKRKLENGVAEEAGAAEAAAAKPAKKKKSKEAAAAAGEQPPKKKSKKDKAAKDSGKKTDSDDEPTAAAAAPAADPNALDNFHLAEGIKSLLRSKGIEALFPIQTACFNLVVGGTDVVGRARTGCGKTLAFVLPIVQSLANSQQKASGGGGRSGRLPSVIVLAPTRELAKQVSVLVCGVCMRQRLFGGRAAAVTSWVMGAE